MPYFPVRIPMEQLQDTDFMEVDSPRRRLSTPTSNEHSRQSHRIRIKNRRRRYLEMHPEYFGADLELVDPLLYDRLIRRFQTPAERIAEDREKGHSGILEADLIRSEAKIEELKNPNPNHNFVYYREESGAIVAEDKDGAPMDRETGLELWQFEMSMRFLQGNDTDFNYKKVDENDEFDDPEEDRERQDAYFDAESPAWASDGEGEERELKGETGIQDY